MPVYNHAAQQMKKSELVELLERAVGVRVPVAEDRLVDVRAAATAVVAGDVVGEDLLRARAAAGIHGHLLHRGGGCGSLGHRGSVPKNRDGPAKGVAGVARTPAAALGAAQSRGTQWHGDGSATPPLR